MIDRLLLLGRVREACGSVPPYEVCRAVLEGRARIVDCFDHGHLRFVVIDPGVRSAPLTAREQSVVLMLAQELSNKVVALDLSMSQATASTLLGVALRKLGVDRWTLLRVLGALVTEGHPVALSA
jgi:DNA-binding NarL/FixJ family response regulator